MLKQFWFIIYPQDKFGPRNIGVSANTLIEAKSIVLETLTKINYPNITQSQIENVEIIENVDIQSLDQNHVIPNMGVVVFKGVWFPNLNH